MNCFLKNLLGAVTVGCLISGAIAADLSYTHWQDLPPGHLRNAFSSQGSTLINNLNIVALSQNQPILIRGGGFTPAGLDWLIKDMNVRTIVDLRGRFDDDKSDQIIALSPATLKAYQQKHAVDRLRNLSPDKTRAYVENLSATTHLPVQYVNLKAEDPKLLTYLDGASAQKPVAMFCQWGVNRSGTGWGVYAAQHGWSKEQAYTAFGVNGSTGKIRNTRDIDYGYNLESRRLGK